MNEALTKLKSIKDVQLEMTDAATWEAQNPRTRQQRTQQLHQDEGHARYFMLFTNEVMHMMKYLSSDKEVALVFMLPELAPRMAAMLNHFLVDLVGPKCSTLKVKEPEKYNFDPRGLLHSIVTIILHFAPFPEFELAMVRDERSFDPGNLRKAVRVLGKSASVRPEHLQALEAFASRCIEVKEEEEANAAQLGDVPDEFQDPITADLMDDPVKLPSGHSVDRAVITRHLLSDETDPFSRARLTVEMLVDDTELRQKIQAWKAKQRAGGGAAPMEEG
jgi:ubiquitin conjugation factor E4 B